MSCLNRKTARYRAELLLGLVALLVTVCLSASTVASVSAKGKMRALALAQMTYGDYVTTAWNDFLPGASLTPGHIIHTDNFGDIYAIYFQGTAAHLAKVSAANNVYFDKVITTLSDAPVKSWVLAAPPNALATAFTTKNSAGVFVTEIDVLDQNGNVRYTMRFSGGTGGDSILSMGWNNSGILVALSEVNSPQNTLRILVIKSDGTLSFDNTLPFNPNDPVGPPPLFDTLYVQVNNNPPQYDDVLVFTENRADGSFADWVVLDYKSGNVILPGGLVVGRSSGSIIANHGETVAVHLAPIDNNSLLGTATALSPWYVIYDRTNVATRISQFYITDSNGSVVYPAQSPYPAQLATDRGNLIGALIAGSQINTDLGATGYGTDVAGGQPFDFLVDIPFKNMQPLLHLNHVPVDFLIPGGWTVYQAPTAPYKFLEYRSTRGGDMFSYGQSYPQALGHPAQMGITSYPIPPVNPSPFSLFSVAALTEVSTPNGNGVILDRHVPGPAIQTISVPATVSAGQQIALTVTMNEAQPLYWNPAPVALTSFNNKLLFTDTNSQHETVAFNTGEISKTVYLTAQPVTSPTVVHLLAIQQGVRVNATVTVNP